MDMNEDRREFAQKAAATYNAAAELFDAAPLGFWDRHGRRTVQLLALEQGAHVLDAGCGTGAAALPAAETVGPNGVVVGLDVAGNMLAIAQAKAAARGLLNVEFRCADMSEGLAPNETFDAILSVFSIFFVPDMEAQIATLWSRLRPGGRLAVTVWGERSFAPVAEIFAEELRHFRPDIPPAPRPWERLTVPEGLRQLLIDGGAADPVIHDGPDRQPLRGPEDWWTIVMGSGFRSEIEHLTPGERGDLKRRVLQRLSDASIQSVETNALHAIAQKP